MKIYQNKNNGNNPIYQNEAFNTTSSKYGFISSEKILKHFEDKGFTLDGVSYADCKNPEKQGFQKHIMLFSRPDLIIDGGNKLQILALNSHDGSNSLRLNAGVYRAVCANGLIAGDEIFERRVRHIGNFIENLEDALFDIVANISKLKDQVVLMQNKTIDFEQSQNFLKKAVDLRLVDIDGLKSVNLATVDQVRRADDAHQDIYTFFNRVQESVIGGGIKYTKEVQAKNADGDLLFNIDGSKQLVTKNGTTRKLKDFKKTIELNKFLFSEALKLAA